MRRLEGLTKAVEAMRAAHDARHKAMLENGYKVCPMCGSNYTKSPVCGVCYDVLMKYKKVGRLPIKLVTHAVAAGLMKGGAKGG